MRPVTIRSTCCTTGTIKGISNITRSRCYASFSHTDIREYFSIRRCRYGVTNRFNWNNVISFVQSIQAECPVVLGDYVYMRYVLSLWYSLEIFLLFTFKQKSIVVMANRYCLYCFFFVFAFFLFVFFLFFCSKMVWYFYDFMNL